MIIIENQLLSQRGSPIQRPLYPAYIIYSSQLVDFSAYLPATYYQLHIILLFLLLHLAYPYQYPLYPYPCYSTTLRRDIVILCLTCYDPRAQLLLSYNNSEVSKAVLLCLYQRYLKLIFCQKLLLLYCSLIQTLYLLQQEGLY